MKLNQCIKRLTPIAAGMLCVSCGGGSNGNLTGIDGSGAPVLPDVGGNEAPNYTLGPISGFGSVLVNGRRYVIDSQTNLSVDGISVLQSALQVGQFVIISSSRTDEDGNPIADQIRSDTLIEGPITNIDTVNNQITVLNQTIIIDGSTVFDDDIPRQTLSGLNLNDVVEITGANNTSGSVLATRVELDDDGDDTKLVGLVSNLDTSNSQFEISGQLINYTRAVLDDIPGGSLSNGDLVKVEGNFNIGTLDATEVEGFDDISDSLNDDDEIEITGPVTNFISPTNFEVNGFRVETSLLTEYEDGTAGLLANGAVVEVEGYWRNGVLVADEVSFEQEDSIIISGNVEDINATDALLNEGTLTIFGITVTTNASTSFEDYNSSSATNFGLDDLAIGDYVEVEGYVSATGDFIMNEVEREDDDTDAEIQGPMTAKNLPASITILDKVIDTSSIDTSALSTVPVGSIVNVDGDIVGGNFVADEVSLETDD